MHLYCVLIYIAQATCGLMSARKARPCEHWFRYLRTCSTGIRGTLLRDNMPSKQQSNGSSAPSAGHPSSLVALPSMSHSLASLPTLSGLPADMLHYGGISRSKTTQTLSEAKVNLLARPSDVWDNNPEQLGSALQRTRNIDDHSKRSLYPTSRNVSRHK